MVDSWFPREIRPVNVRFRLFCFPYAGGGAAVYRDWSESFPPWVEVIPLVPPGREHRVDEEPCADLKSLVDGAATALRPHLDVPYALFGHSLGALVAYHAAHWLRDAGLTGPDHLFVAGHRAPQLPDRVPALYGLPDDAFVDGVTELGGMPAELAAEPEFLRYALPALRADFTISDTYTWAGLPPLDCPVTAFGGVSDPTVSEPELAAWRETTTGVFRSRQLPGDHFFLNSARHLLTGMVESGIQRGMRARARLAR